MPTNSHIALISFIYACVYIFQIFVSESKLITCKDPYAQFYQLTTKLISIITYI